MVLAGYAVGARQGYLFIRGEYPQALSRLQAALDEAAAAGFVGENIMGSGFSLPHRNPARSGRVHLR